MKKIKPLKFDAVSENGETFVRIHVDASLIDLGVKTFSVSRPGTPSPCLGEHGWQAAENRFALQVDPIVREAFLVPQVIYMFLDSSTNYQLVFFDSLSVPLAGGVMRVKGGIGRRGAPVTAHASHAAPLTFESVTSKTKLDVIAGSLPDHSEPRDVRSLSEWGSAPATAPALFEQSSLQPAKHVTAPDIQREFDPHLETRARAVLTKCTNPGCGASIVSSMQTCPFCGSTK